MSGISNLSVSKKQEQAIAERLGEIRHFEKYRKGSIFTLVPLRSFLKSLGNLEKQFRGIQVLGTNGKGSTAFYLAWIASFRERTGLFTSPHAFSYRERIAWFEKGKVGFISYSTFLNILGKINKHCRQTRTALSPFEKLTVASYLFFARRKASYIVLEAGLGGRLDATSTFQPDAHLFTPIALDHTALLGKKCQQIAREKGLAIKPKTHVYTFPQKRSVMTVLRELAQERECRFTLLPSPRPLAKGTLAVFPFFLLSDKGNPYLLPTFSTAIASSFHAAQAVSFSEKKASFPSCPSPPLPFLGRRTLLRNNPPLLFDGAHNPEAIKELVREIQLAFPSLKWQVIFGCLKDKAYKEMMLPLMKIAISFFSPQLPPPFLPSNLLAQSLSNRAVENYPFPSSSFSIRRPVLLTGSFRLASLLPSLGKKSVKVVPFPFSD